MEGIFVVRFIFVTCQNLISCLYAESSYYTSASFSAAQKLPKACEKMQCTSKSFNFSHGVYLMGSLSIFKSNPIKSRQNPLQSIKYFQKADAGSVMFKFLLQQNTKSDYQRQSVTLVRGPRTLNWLRYR